MADSKLTEQQVADLVTVLRGDASLDKKIQDVNHVKTGIKQHNVPDACVPQLFDGLRLASASQHGALAAVGFTSLNHLLTRLSRQEPKLLTKEAPRTLPLIVEKLGDPKDKMRSTAQSSLATLYPVASPDVERSIRNSALTGKNPRAKEGGMAWLLQTHKEQGLQFRSYVPLLMDLLEDADGMVRDAAKSTVIELFRNAPNTAKSDLKRQLKNFKVRPAIEQAIIKALAPPGGRSETPVSQPAAAPAPARPALGASASSLSSDRPVTPAVDVRADNIEPRYVNTNRELDDIFKDMAWCFEGRESEQNWMKREESMTTLRKLNAGNVGSDFPDAFLTGLRSMLDGILKAINSLRTSLSKEGCGLVQDIAIAFGPGIDPMVELLMQTLVKLSAGTKKIASQLANSTVDVIISHVSYSQRLMQHIWGAVQDKNVNPRTYATGWLKTILKKESAHKSHMEHTGGVDLFEKCIKKGLGDANPAVREKMRSTFWAFWGVWPQRADAIKDDLDATAQKLLNKDPSNPNSPKKGEAAPATRPGLGLSKSTMTGSKPSLREHMMAQKKATLEAKKLPARPGSAMANISPVRKVSNEEKPGAKPSGSRTRPEAGTISVNASGMSVAPMRPARRRPEVAARPATAGPYSVRDQPSSTEASSPGASRAKAPTPRQLKETTPRRPVSQRPKPGHSTHASESSIHSPGSRPKSSASHHSPAKLRTARTTQATGSPAPKAQEDITLEVPTVTSLPEPVAPAPVEPESPEVSQPEAPEPEVSQPEPAPAPEPVSEPAPEPVPEPEVAEPEPSQPPPEVQLPPPAADEQPSEPEKPAAPAVGLDSQPQTPAKEPLKVYEDPFVEEQAAPKTTFTGSVLEAKPVNEDAANLLSSTNGHATAEADGISPEKAKQNSRLLESGVSKVKAKTLEVHGFRKFQSLLRDNKTPISDEKFETLLLGLFQYLEDPLPGTATDKAQDIKAQILTTIKLLLKRERDNFQPHVSKCLESLVHTRSSYENRAHIVSGLELLADELVSIGDATEIIVVLTRRMQESTDASNEGSRALSMGLHVLKALLDKRGDELVIADTELSQLATLAGRCLESADSGVRMDAVQLCVALHSRVGEQRFWDSIKGVKDDPKSLITYYIVKKQREQSAAAA